MRGREEKDRKGGEWGGGWKKKKIKAQLKTTDCTPGGNPKISQTPAKILGISVNTTHLMNLRQTQDCQHLTNILANIMLSFICIKAGNLLFFVCNKTANSDRKSIWPLFIQGLLSNTCSFTATPCLQSDTNKTKQLAKWVKSLQEPIIKNGFEVIKEYKLFGFFNGFAHYLCTDNKVVFSSTV